MTARAEGKLSCVGRRSPWMAASTGMQHTNDCGSSRSVADEAQDPNLLHRRAEVPDVGSLAARRVAA